jgi:alpha-L-fucosidase 2
MKLCVVFVLLAVAGAAQAQPCLPLEVRNPEGNYIVPGSKGDIPYAPGLSLDAYAQPTKNRPSVVVVHGGGWSAGSRAAHVGQFLETITRAGYHWFSVDYRSRGLDRYEDSLADLRAALAFIRCRSGELGVDPSQIVLLGEDSGAHLAALLAAEGLPGVTGAILVGGFYDLRAVPAQQRGGIDDAALAGGSPMSRVSSRLPNTLVVHGTADREAPVEQARQYCDAVRQAIGRCDLIEVAGASHRAENWWPSQWSYKGDLIGWLRTIAPQAETAHAPQRGAVQKDVVYSRGNRLTMDAYLPARRPRGPAVVIVHGGGWEAGDKVTYVTPLFEPLARAGLAWFSIDYRLTPDVDHPRQLEDLRRAIRFVRANHARFNIDPARIVLIGESAGGQMVAQLAAEDSSLAAVVSFYGVYDFEAMVTDASPRSLLVRLFRRRVLDERARALLRKYSPLHSAHRGMPPMLLVNGTGERLWAQAQDFDRRLSELGVRHDVIALPGAPHGMENWEGHAEWVTYKQRLVDWINRAVLAKPAGN